MNSSPQLQSRKLSPPSAGSTSGGDGGGGGLLESIFDNLHQTIHVCHHGTTSTMYQK